MSKEETYKVKVFVGGKLVTLEELKQKYADMVISGIPGNIRVIETLAETDRPLNRHEIAKKVKMSPGYTRDILKHLLNKKLVVEFQMGGRVNYYLLTEKGFNFYQKIKKPEIPKKNNAR